MPLVRFISPVDPKWLSTLQAIERELSEDAFVYRYRNLDNYDGLDGDEGSFTCCSFWMVECLARAGQKRAAISISCSAMRTTSACFQKNSAGMATNSATSRRR